MMEIDWKSLSISLIISIIVNGAIGIYLLNDYLTRISSSFDFLVKEYLQVTSGNNSSNTVVTIAEGSSNVLYIWLIMLIVSFVLITSICYPILNRYYNRKL